MCALSVTHEHHALPRANKYCFNKKKKKRKNRLNVKPKRTTERCDVDANHRPKQAGCKRTVNPLPRPVSYQGIMRTIFTRFETGRPGCACDPSKFHARNGTRTTPDNRITEVM